MDSLAAEFLLRERGRVVGDQCAIQCARKGSPLVILRDDGAIFLPIAESMPATGQKERLMPYAGKRVKATGRVYTRNGSQAMVIDELEEAK